MTKEEIYAKLIRAELELNALVSFVTTQLDDIYDIPEEEVEAGVKDFCDTFSDKLHSLRQEFIEDDSIYMEIAEHQSQNGKFNWKES